MTKDVDWDDPAVEERWCDEQRESVRLYLAGQGTNHGRIGEWPAYHFAPYLSIWAIESVVAPGKMGWWVISGDFPTDYFSYSAEVDHPRKVLIAAASRWETFLDNVSKGIPDDVIEIRGIESNLELQEMLRSRIGSFREIANNQEVWDDFEADMA